MSFVRKQMRSRRAKGLSVPQFRTLLLLFHFPGATLSAVAEHVATSLPTASRMIDGLVKKALVTRKTCRDDRRQVSLCITARGSAALDAAYSGTRAVLAERFANLSEAQLADLTASMSLLAELFKSNPACGGAESHPVSLAQTA